MFDAEIAEQHVLSLLTCSRLAFLGWSPWLAYPGPAGSLLGLFVHLVEFDVVVLSSCLAHTAAPLIVFRPQSWHMWSSQGAWTCGPVGGGGGV